MDIAPGFRSGNPAAFPVNEQDRDAIVLRFFEGKALKEVGDALGGSEDAAQNAGQPRAGQIAGLLPSPGHHDAVGRPGGGDNRELDSGRAGGHGGCGRIEQRAAVAPSTALTEWTGAALMKNELHMITSAKVSVVISPREPPPALSRCKAQQISTQQHAFKQLEAQVALQTQTSRERQAQIAQLEERVASYVDPMESMARDAAKSRANPGAARDARQVAAAASKEAAQAKGDPLLALMKDPEYLNDTLAMRKRQFAPLVKRLKLTGKQADKFFQIMADQEKSSFDAMRSGNMSTMTNFEPALRSLLGDAGCAQYNDFIVNMNYEITLNDMRGDFVHDPLTDVQEQQLIEAMKTAKKNVPMPGYGKLNLSQNQRTRSKSANCRNNSRNKPIWMFSRRRRPFFPPDQQQILATSISRPIAAEKRNYATARKMFGNSNTPP